MLELAKFVGPRSRRSREEAEAIVVVAKRLSIRSSRRYSPSRSPFLAASRQSQEKKKRLLLHDAAATVATTTLLLLRCRDSTTEVALQ